MKKQFVIMALRNMVRYRTRSMLTGISILLGTTAIILGLSLTDGIIRQTIIGFTGTLVEDVMAFPSDAGISKGYKEIEKNSNGDSKEKALMFVNAFRNQSILQGYNDIEKSVGEIAGIDYITKKVQFFGALFSEMSSQHTMILGMEPEGIRRKANLKMEKGRYLIDDDRLSLIISERLARRLRIDVGDKLAVVANMPGGGTNAKDFRVKGIFSIITGLQFAEELIYISLKDAQDLMGLTETQVFSLGIYLKDVDAVDVFVEKIRKKLEGDGLFYSIHSWKTVMKGILAQYYFIKHIVLLFTIVLLLIVCVGVVNAVFLSVSERTREIGTMMAMGAKRKTIVFIFMVEGAILSLISASLGCLLGASVSLLFEKIGLKAPTEGAAWLFSGKQLFPYLTYSTTLFTFFFVITVTLLGISYPIIKASKLEPTEALGYV
ncbi:MAG: ABC transporter permease [Promethearchaeota archaeon]|jgi:putative ABC transport system permease protein